LEWDYKIRPHSDHVAKFQGDRSRELGEGVAKKKKEKEDTSRVKHKPVQNYRMRNEICAMPRVMFRVFVYQQFSKL